MPRPAATALSQPDLPDLSLGDIARQVLEDASGQRAIAVEALSAQLAKNPGLRRRVADEAIQIAMMSIMVRAQLNNRGSILRAVGAGREGVRSLATGLMRGVLDMPMLDGSPLRDATPEDLTAMIEHYRARVTGMNRMIRFLAAVLKVVPEQGCVGDVLTEEKANELLRRHHK